MCKWNDWVTLKEMSKERINISDFGKVVAQRAKPDTSLSFIVVSAEKEITVYVNILSVSSHSYSYISWSPMNRAGVVGMGLYIPPDNTMPDRAILAQKFDEALKKALEGKYTLNQDVIVQ